MEGASLNLSNWHLSSTTREMYTMKDNPCPRAVLGRVLLLALRVPLLSIHLSLNSKFACAVSSAV